MADWTVPAQGGVFAALLLIASVTDIRSRIIPNSVCAGIALIGLLRFDPANLTGILIAAPFLIIAQIWSLFGLDALGGGDIKLMAAAGFLLGLPAACSAVIIGLSVMLPFCLIYRIVNKLRGRKTPRDYPLAPFLSLGCMAAFIIANGGIPL